MFCGNCGRQIDDNAAVCPFCGQAQARRAASAAPAPNTGYTPAPNAGYTPAANYSPAGGGNSVSSAVKNMNKKQKNILIGAIAAVVVLIIIIIAASGSKNIVGRWIAPDDPDSYMEFYKDGTGTLDGDEDFEYETGENGTITFYFDEYHLEADRMYYEIKGNKLYFGDTRSELEENIEEGLGWEKD